MEDKFLERINTYPRFLIPLFTVGYVRLIQDAAEWEHLFSLIDKDYSVVGHAGHSCYIQANTTGEWIFLLGCFDYDIPTLVHEAAHITFNVLNVVGEEVAVDRSNETFCYLLEQIVDWAITAQAATKKDKEKICN